MNIYARTVTITRPSNAATGGQVAYIGQNRADETTVAAALPASVQSKSVGSRRSGTDKIAADAPGPIVWDIFIPRRALAKGLVRDRDIVTDDEGIRYQVAAAYWNILGWHLQTIRLEM